MKNNGLQIKPVKKKGLSEYDKFIQESQQRLEKSADDLSKRTLSLNHICTKLIQFKEQSKIEVAVDHFSRNSDIPRHIWNNTIKRIKQEHDDTEIRAQDILPQITRVENFISYNYDIRFNEISLLYECKVRQQKVWRELNVNSIWRNMQKHHIDYSASNITNLIKSDFTPAINPISEYFRNLPEWDGTDYIDKLSNYINVSLNDEKRFKWHLKKMFVRVIASALGKAFNKHAFGFVHEGHSSGKSTLIRWLCPKKLQDYYLEDINTDKDGLIALSQNVFINLDELASFSRANINSLKSYMSKDWIKVRIPYDRSPSLVKRRSSFFFSTNDPEFLTDPTGSVRWICFRLIGDSPINWDYKKHFDINNIWSQAHYLYNTGFEYQLTREEIKENNRINIQFYVNTVEIDLIQKYFSPGEEGDKHSIFMTATDIVIYINQKTSNSFKLQERNIGRALIFLGFGRSSNYQIEMGYSIKGYWVKNTKNKTFKK